MDKLTITVSPATAKTLPSLAKAPSLFVPGRLELETTFAPMLRAGQALCAAFAGCRSRGERKVKKKEEKEEERKCRTILAWE